MRAKPAGARTPEELDTLFEDAFLLRDAAALAELFHPRAVLVVEGGRRTAHGRDEIAAAAAELWAGGHSYLAGARRVVQSRDTALVLGEGGVHVLRRDDDSWRYAISLLDNTRRSP